MLKTIAIIATCLAAMFATFMGLVIGLTLIGLRPDTPPRVVVEPRVTISQPTVAEPAHEIAEPDPAVAEVAAEVQRYPTVEKYFSAGNPNPPYY